MHKQDASIRLLSTRSLSKGVKDEALERGIALLDLDFLKIDYIPNEQVGPALNVHTDPLVFTSIHGVNGVVLSQAANPELFSGRPAFSISGRTAQKARLEGFNVLGTGATGRELAHTIIESGPQKVIYFCGKKHRRELPELLKAAGITCEKIPVYKKTPVAHRVDGVQGILFFSPSQVDAFLVKNKLKPGQPVFTIGPTTGGYVKSKGHDLVIEAALSSESGIMRAVYEHFKKKS
jgi:uroporphyrinogen-III synthase